ncbi:putative MltA-interacting MipA family protein [uncultured Alphaproteobacteria bacterium]|uniref:Putative MltA-interacting MipA family protein n=1 Tax=uncultured Alphaproteobacteria bacterium TaxID=91750 RepID=A0A212JGQ7_9PROT|nr:putative MltA-interacting MipA family protein [uncultured Alphaproteobacteria bacterium]
MSTSYLRGVAIAAFATLAVCGPVRAESGLVVGAGGAWKPDYLGSDDYEAAPLPMLRYSWSGETAASPASGYKSSLGLIDVQAGFPDGIDVGVARIATPSRNFTLRLGGGYRFGRDADDNHALRGMGDIDGQGIARVTLASEPANPRGLGTAFGLKYEMDVTDETDGETLSLFVDHALPLSASTTLTLSGDLRWADDDQMQAYFGVSPTQAARSGHRRFDADSGFSDAGLAARLDWSFAEHWILSGRLGYTRLLGDAADSPLVDDDGSANQFVLSTAVAYRF